MLPWVCDRERRERVSESERERERERVNEKVRKRLFGRQVLILALL